MPSKQEHIKDEKERNSTRVLPKEERNNRHTWQSQNNQATYQRILLHSIQHRGNYQTQDFNDT